MYELKTKETDVDVIEFIESVESEKKREDAYRLLDIVTEMTGLEAKMWGPSIIGFGKYHYQYESGHKGEAPLVGFSPRKAKHSLYFASGEWREPLLKELGKHKAGKACIYVNKLDDVHEEILKRLITASIDYLRKIHPEE